MPRFNLNVILEAALRGLQATVLRDMQVQGNVDFCLDTVGIRVLVDRCHQLALAVGRARTVYWNAPDGVGFMLGKWIAGEPPDKEAWRLALRHKTEHISTSYLAIDEVAERLQDPSVIDVPAVVTLAYVFPNGPGAEVVAAESIEPDIVIAYIEEVPNVPNT